MKNIKYKIIIFSLSLVSLVTLLNSCSNDDATITDPRRFTANDVKSYEDLFVVFWKTMDQQYNYFYEQKDQNGVDWDNVYKNYLPKFAALKTYGRPTEDDGQINEDYLQAKGYFEEIIDPIIDRHFYVDIQFPITNKGVIMTSRFYGGMLSEDDTNTYPYTMKYRYMQNRVASTAFKLNATTINPFSLIAGNLNSNPEIFYLTFNQFAATSNLQLSLANDYLNPGAGNALLLTEEVIENSATLNQIQNTTLRNDIKNITVNILKQYNSFSESPQFKKFIEEARAFNTTEIVSNDFILSAQSALTAYNLLPKYKTNAPFGISLNADTEDFIYWFRDQMNIHVDYGYRFPNFTTAVSQVIVRGPFYQKFLNPLHKGEVKKIIIDLRSNGGGAVVDARFISDRFVTQNKTFAYQRTREGNGRFNYTPWVEAKTNAHKFGIPSNIPIAILTDRGSASMSEMTTLMLKSQGNHVVSVGDYSAGATAGLGSTDDFNGGTRDAIAGGKLTFYMPLLAMKDFSGAIVEGVGIKPDILVTPPTDAELTQMSSSPNTFVDRVLQQAIEYLQSK